jgi:hypothetical protein
MNTSVDFIPDEQVISSDDAIDFSLDWRYGIPLYYFTSKEQKTTFVIQLYTDLEIRNVYLKSYTIGVSELGINYTKENIADEFSIEDTYLGNDTAAKKRFWCGKRVVVDYFLPKNIENEKQLSMFKKVKDVVLTAVIEYEHNGEKKTSTIIWRLKPVVRKSSEFWDKLMSV